VQAHPRRSRAARSRLLLVGSRSPSSLARGRPSTRGSKPRRWPRPRTIRHRATASPNCSRRRSVRRAIACPHRAKLPRAPQSVLASAVGRPECVRPRGSRPLDLGIAAGRPIRDRPVQSKPRARGRPQIANERPPRSSAIERVDGALTLRDRKQPESGPRRASIAAWRRPPAVRPGASPCEPFAIIVPR
jgi:hypothetical protein